MKILKFIDKYFEKWFLIVSLIAMVLITFMQIVFRWFGHATVWAEELSRYIMLYQVWIGASYAVHEDAHIRITSFIGKLTAKKREKLELIVLTIWLAFAVWLTIEGIILVNKISIMKQVSSAMRIPMTVPYSSVPIGSALMSLRLIQKIVETLNSSSQENKEVA